LQMLDDGHLTDSKGRKVSFKNTIIIMTSNVGAQRMNNDLGVGFAASNNEQQAEEEKYKRMKDAVMEEMKRAFRPEFLNRLDDIVIFKHLTRTDMRKIVDIMKKDLENRLKEKGMTIVLTDEVKDKVSTEGYNRTYGARPMKRSIQKLLEDPISDSLINRDLTDGDEVEAYLVFNEEFPKEKVYETPSEVTEETKEADRRQALVKAEIKFRVVGKLPPEKQEELKKSTIKKKKKALGLNSSGGASPSEVGGGEPVSGGAG